MNTGNTRLLLIFVGLVVAVIIALSNWPRTNARTNDDGSTEGHPAAKVSESGDSPPTKTQRDQKESLDDGGFQFGTPEWYGTEAGREFAKNVPQALLDMAPREASELEAGRHTEIIENLTFVMQSPSVPKVGYRHKQAISGDWRTLERF